MKRFWTKWYGGPLVLACLFWLVSYFVTNLDFPISGEKQVITWTQYIIDALKLDALDYEDNPPVWIDVSYDRQLAEEKVARNRGDSSYYKGTTSITDRGKLLRLLQFFHDDTTRYGYIFLDVAFDSTISTEYDSALFHVICDMPRIVVGDDGAINPILKPKAGEVAYTTTLVESDLVKYPYLNSAPLKMYEDNTGSKIKQWGPFYFDGCHLSRKSIVLTLDVLADHHTFLGDWTGGDAPKIETDNCNGQIVVIGAIAQNGDDVHHNYRGYLSGPEINYNAYVALCKGHHRMSWIVGVLIFLLLYYFCLKTLRQWNVADKITKKDNHFHRVLRAMASWLKYPFWITLLCILTFLIWKEVYDIFITTTLFWVLNIVVTQMKYYQNKKNHE